MSLEPFELLTRELPWVMFAWFTFVGGCIGSFMNVVVYRSPLGLSLSHPPSRCPQCEHRIRWHDNLPVIGWLKLGGKCRDCRGKIPARYPLVEALFMSVFAIGWYRYMMHPASLEFAVDLTRVLSYATLISILLGLALIRLDRQRIPFGLVLPAVIGPCLVLPMLLIRDPAWQFDLPTRLGGMLAGAAGMWLIARFPPVSERTEVAEGRVPAKIAVILGIAIGFVAGPLPSLAATLGVWLLSWLLQGIARFDWAWTLAVLAGIAVLWPAN